MTSNLGSHLIQNNFDELTEKNRGEVLEKTRNQLLDLLKKTIRPEFLNRIDETIIFTPLTRNDIKDVVKIQFERILERLNQQGLDIEITENAIDWIGTVGYDPHFGARPIKRILQKYILNDLSKKIIQGDISKDQKITIDIEDQELVFRT